MGSNQAKPKLRPIDPEFWTIENELPDPLPVSKAELDAIERYFGGVLDVVFDTRPRIQPAPTTPHQKGDK